MFEPSPENAYQSAHIELLCSSFFRLTGQILPGLESAEDEPARAVYCSAWAVVSHDTSSDPVFNYANQAAMRAFEMDWPVITRLPSRKSVESIDIEKRRELMRQVTDNGYVSGYQGIRVAASGRRFWIRNATIWNLLDPTNTYRGQAAIFELGPDA